MSDDLVKRLRDNCSCNFPDTPCGAEEQCRNAFEAADRIEQLEAANLKASLITVDHLSRIEKLEAALRKIAQHDMQAVAIDALHPGERIRKALEGNDD